MASERGGPLTLMTRAAPSLSLDQVDLLRGYGEQTLASLLEGLVAVTLDASRRSGVVIWHHRVDGLQLYLQRDGEALRLAALCSHGDPEILLAPLRCSWRHWIGQLAGLLSRVEARGERWMRWHAALGSVLDSPPPAAGKPALATHERATLLRIRGPHPVCGRLRIPRPASVTQAFSHTPLALCLGVGDLKLSADGRTLLCWETTPLLPLLGSLLDDLEELFNTPWSPGAPRAFTLAGRPGSADLYAGQLELEGENHPLSLTELSQALCSLLLGAAALLRSWAPEPALIPGLAELPQRCQQLRLRLRAPQPSKSDTELRSAGPQAMPAPALHSRARTIAGESLRRLLFVPIFQGESGVERAKVALTHGSALLWNGDQAALLPLKARVAKHASGPPERLLPLREPRDALRFVLPAKDRPLGFWIGHAQGLNRINAQGRTLYKFELEARPESEALIWKGLLFVLDRLQTLHALSLSDRILRWQQETPFSPQGRVWIQPTEGGVQLLGEDGFFEAYALNRGDRLSHGRLPGERLQLRDPDGGRIQSLVRSADGWSARSGPRPAANKKGYIPLGLDRVSGFSSFGPSRWLLGEAAGEPRLIRLGRDQRPVQTPLPAGAGRPLELCAGPFGLVITTESGQLYQRLREDAEGAWRVIARKYVSGGPPTLRRLGPLLLAAHDRGLEVLDPRSQRALGALRLEGLEGPITLLLGSGSRVLLFDAHGRLCLLKLRGHLSIV